MEYLQLYIINLSENNRYDKIFKRRGFMQTTNKEVGNINVIKNSVLGHNLAILRDKDSTFDKFRHAAKQISGILM